MGKNRYFSQNPVFYRCPQERRQAYPCSFLITVPKVPKKLQDDGTIRKIEFIQAVTAGKPKEWSDIRIDDGKSAFGKPCCEYRSGRLASKPPEELLGKKVLSAKACGGWSNMNYQLVIET